MTDYTSTTDPTLMTDQHRRNLRVLADYLLSLPADYGNFDMKSYSVVKKRSKTSSFLPFRTECGCVCCAAGHGPLTGDPALKPLPREDWIPYVQRVFGVLNVGAISTYDDWKWMFSSQWEHTDNTPRGAGLRIIYFLDHGLPENASEQMWGEAPLCYAAPPPAAP